MLGKKVECLVTGFTGIATSEVKYINGCIQYCVKPKVGKDKVMPEGHYIDVQQLKVIGDGVELIPTPTGGPQADCPSH